MTKNKLESARKEYFTSCGVALFSAVAGVISSGEVGLGFLLGVALVVFLVIVVLTEQRGGVDEQTEAVLEERASRMLKMAMMWFVMAAVLAVSLFRETVAKVWAGMTGKVSPMDWLLAFVGIGIVVFCVFRIVGAIKR